MNDYKIKSRCPIEAPIIVSFETMRGYKSKLSKTEEQNKAMELTVDK